MVKIIVHYSKQSIKRIDSNQIVADSNNYVYIQFVPLDEIWLESKIESLETLFMLQNGKNVYVAIDPKTGICRVPDECISGSMNSFNFMLYGTFISSDEKRTVTTNRITVDIIPSGFDKVPRPDAYSKLADRVTALETEIEQINTSSISAFQVKLDEFSSELQNVNKELSIINSRLTALETSNPISNSGSYKIRLGGDN